MTRLLDIVLSGLALLVLSPLLIPLAIALKLTGEGEILFVQPRVGQHGQLFGLYKFATMLKDSPNIGAGTVTLKDDPRVLPLGKFLRATKINELPQLLNVLAGDMSIIGPRPQTRRCFDAFPEQCQTCIITVRPGLSGIGSIVFRGEERLLSANAEPDKMYDDLIMPHKGELEVWYVQNQSFSIYVKCIVATIITVIYPNSNVISLFFAGLPSPPPDLQRHMTHMKESNSP